jgi:uncharacterized protein (DUF924 family)
MARVDDVLNFWFGPPSEPAHIRPRALWFERDEAFDAECTRRFQEAYEQAAAGALDSWRDEPRGALALLLLLDQLPRNVFRGSPRAYATDERAREVARQALARGLDVPLPPVWRWFFYLPFMHSEDLQDQRRSVALIEPLTWENADSAITYESARRHHDIVARFGRFPHRNAALGRESTPEEVTFLQEPDSAF